jgi:hypothetical protein
MAKNKNRDRGKQQAPSAPARGADESKPSSVEDQAEQTQSRIAPSDISSNGRQKRFGHN